MLIHPWDSAGPDEWRSWLDTTAPFGHLAINNIDPSEPPIMVPTHAVIEGTELLVHLARPNPAWPHIGANPRLLYSVTNDSAFIPGPWRAPDGTPPELGVPTSYYATVQFTCDSEIIDDPQAKAELLRSQLRHLQPDGDHAEVDVDAEPYGRLLPGIRGLRLTIIEVVAKFKYDDHKPIEHRSRVSQLLVQRGGLQDAGAARQQTRRLAERGEWKQP